MNGEYDIREETDLAAVVKHLKEQSGAARMATLEFLAVRLAEEVIALKTNSKRPLLSLGK